MNIDREKYTSHITNMDDLSNMRRVLDLIEIVSRDHIVDSTDFFDPYTCKLARSILNRFNKISYREIGGLDGAERKIILIYPDYYYLLEEDYTISALRLKGDTDGLSHPDFLGSILSLGISRDKLGDILVHDGYTDIIIKDDIKDFVSLNLEKIARRNFEIEEIEFNELIPVKEEFEEVDRTLSSLRLDAYIGSTYNLSRNMSQKIVENGNVKVNWEPVDKPSFEIYEGDMVSTRGYGRSRLHSVDGLSRKNRIIVKIRRLL